MNGFLFFVSLILIVSLSIGPAFGVSKNTAPAPTMLLVNKHLQIFEEGGSILTAEDIVDKYQQNTLSANGSGKVSWGFTDKTIWGVLPVEPYAYELNLSNNEVENALDSAFIRHSAPNLGINLPVTFA